METTLFTDKNLGTYICTFKQTNFQGIVGTYGTTYVYAWGNNEKRKTMKGRECVVLARGAKNSCMIQFLDNSQRECVSRNSLRKKV